jgi:hypothetical protein
MRYAFGHEAILMALAVGFAGIALYNGAASLSDEAENVAAPAVTVLAGTLAGRTGDIPDGAEESTGSIGTVGVGRRDLLTLDDEQRGLIFLGIINLPDVADAEIAHRAMSVRVPDEVELHDLPAMVTNRIPRVQGYKFAKLADRILVVHPATRSIVAEIPRYHLVR